MKIADLVILIITCVWAIAIIVSINDRGYQLPNSVQIAMGAVIAFLFGNKVLKNGGSK